jgi:hypothetical protein
MNSRNLFAAVIVLAWNALPLPLRAQSPSPAATPTPAEPMMVRAVEIHCEGLSPAQRKKLAARMRPFVDHPYSEAALEEAARNSMGNTVQFGNRIFGEAVPGGVRVVFSVRASK